MILADSSAWVEFLRGTGSPVHLELTAMLSESGDIACTEVVVMELLGGARDGSHANLLERLLYGQEFLPVEAPLDYEVAADLYRRCRAAGETLRGFADCLIAAVAIRVGVEVLAAHGDFIVLARHTPLRLAI